MTSAAGLAADSACAYPATCPPSSSGSGVTEWLGIIVVAVLVSLVLVPFLRARLPWPGRGTWRTRGDREQKRARSADTSTPSVHLSDVAGCDEAKAELAETIDFLRSPARFHELGARIPHGVLMYGPPGTGKTMLAKAVATEAGVAFLYASGSEFVEKWVGVGARRIRDLFGRARSQGRCVVFIDEFDAIARTRGGPNANEEREQSLNQLLVELDGFSTTDDTVVIAATNRLDVLDPAVLRPGRFSRKVHVGLPDRDGRLAILEVHAKAKPLGPDVDLPELARKTYGFSGADLADLLNEAAIRAARRRSRTITPEDVQAGWLKVAVGTSRRRSMNERERAIIAAHEIGHAICGRVHGDSRRVEEISLYAHGEALGVTVTSEEDNFLPSESDLRARLVALMGGRAAEELVFAEVTGGASNDLQKANEIAVAMITRWGMGRDPDTEPGRSGRGALSFVVGDLSSLPGEFGPAAQRAISAILDDAYGTATGTLVTEMDRLRAISNYLCEHERIDGATFERLFENPPVANRATIVPGLSLAGIEEIAGVAAFTGTAAVSPEGAAAAETRPSGGRSGALTDPGSGKRFRAGPSRSAHPDASGSRAGMRLPSGPRVGEAVTALTRRAARGFAGVRGAAQRVVHKRPIRRGSSGKGPASA